MGSNLVFVVVRDGYPRFEPFSDSVLLGVVVLAMLLASCSLLLGGVLVAWVLGCRCCSVLLVSAPTGVLFIIDFVQFVQHRVGQRLEAKRYPYP